ncbi:MAG TPA: glutamine amidotransferase [Thermoguttaceae bacterium]|nr:glutamine amidotransferase [Thermoguttaceae bacterium]
MPKMPMRFRWMGRMLICGFIVAGLVVASAGRAGAEERKIRVLFVGGDWKAQLTNFQGKRPLRGHFVRQEVEKAAPGKFDFTLWTSYEFLQYGDRQALRAFDVIVAGDFKGEAILPRLMRGLADFVEGGGGFLYGDNHKAFTWTRLEQSLDEVLPIESVLFRPYDGGKGQPLCDESPLTITIAAAGHPAVRGLDWAGAPPLAGAHYGQLKAGATVVATSPKGVPIWVAWEKGKGRALWLGGVLANDELSEKFAEWPEFGKFYAQLLAWLAEKSAYPRVDVKDATTAAGPRCCISVAICYDSRMDVWRGCCALIRLASLQQHHWHRGGAHGQAGTDAQVRDHTACQEAGGLLRHQRAPAHPGPGRSRQRRISPAIPGQEGLRGMDGAGRRRRHTMSERRSHLQGMRKVGIAKVVPTSTAAPVPAAVSPTSPDACDDRIQKNRIADVTLTVTDAEGKPLPGAAVTVRQERHKFLFGCNAFPIRPSDTGKAQQDYRDRFTALP